MGCVYLTSVNHSLKPNELSLQKQNTHKAGVMRAISSFREGATFQALCLHHYDRPLSKLPLKDRNFILCLKIFIFIFICPQQLWTS